MNSSGRDRVSASCMHLRGSALLISLALAWSPESFAQTAEESSPPPRRARRESAPTRRWWPLATLRVLGGATVITYASDNIRPEWALDVHAGLRLIDAGDRKSVVILSGDVGLSYGPRSGDTRALWLAGAGISFGSVVLTIGWSPRLVYGRIDGETALGLRNTFSLGFLTGVVTLDVAHQYLSVADDSQHDIRLTLGVDVGLIGQMLIQFAEVRPG